ncbi:response regulator [Deinococcus koreensis]|uniref:Response regulatory domain-containing protein n=1 Tax=Deinococcus koreensis TaxID=2054903 RepID=A0A2K3UWA1_9DEIO|nr:response regulator [Deinococcus koreensis]PNY80806.1 hypothetical protein CVO96_04965 [Deinococcus koreensis]
MTAPVPRRPVVLIVDDSPGVLSAMKHLLAAHLTVQVAENGAAALQAITPETDLVLSDIRMPGMDGLELMRVLQRGRPHLPVVLMTGVVEDGLRTRAQGLGALDVLRKPLRAETLFPSLQEWLAGQEGAANLSFPDPGSAAPGPAPMGSALGPRSVTPGGGRLPSPNMASPEMTSPGMAASRAFTALPSDPRQAAQALLRPLVLLPGVMSTGLFTADGELLAAEGEMTVQMGAYLRFLNTTAQTLGTHLDAQDEVRAAQLEFGDRVLVACFRPGEMLAVLVSDTPAASSVKGWVRQRWGTRRSGPVALN